MRTYFQIETMFLFFETIFQENSDIEIEVRFHLNIPFWINEYLKHLVSNSNIHNIIPNIKEENTNVNCFVVTILGEKTSRILFKCKICKFSSKDETKLIKHENIHNTKYKFSCTICERRFRLQSNCNRHIR